MSGYNMNGDGKGNEDNNMSVYRINVMWDDEVSVWVATSDDVPGLVAEASTQPDLLNKLRELIPELLKLNGISVENGAPEVPISLLYQQEIMLRTA